jgi:hypothetical protein
MDTIKKEEYLKLSGKKSKYGNKRTEARGLGSFHSRKEAQYIEQTHLEWKAKKIKAYEVQVTFPCIVNGIKICDYIADVVVTHLDDRKQIIDVKGARTYAFNLKWKLVKALYPGYELTLA